MPILNLGKRREALTGKAELFKKKVIEYLEMKGYYLKIDSFIEGTLPDCVLSRKNEDREYWLEAKATTISLYDARFASELGKYLVAYLVRSPQKRFKMKLAIYNYRKARKFGAIYEELDASAIKELIEFMLSIVDEKTRETIQNADSNDIKQFFEDTEVIRATPQDLQEAVEKIRPKPPLRPKLGDAQYAVEVLNRYRTSQPLEEEDVLLSSLFALELPKNIYMAGTQYRSIRQITRKHPEVIIPPLRLVGKKIYSLDPISDESHLAKILEAKSAEKVELEKWDTTDDTRNIVLYLLYYWMDSLCEQRKLSYDERTESYFFSDYRPRKFPKVVHWRKGRRVNTRKVIIPVRREDGEIYYYAHRAVQVKITKLWNEYFVQLLPRWVFSGDCYNPYPGEISDKIDRAYRKSMFTRNRNQLNDVLFWSKYLFAEGAKPIEEFLERTETHGYTPSFRVVNQLSVVTDRRPNIPDSREEEDTDIDTWRILDSFLEEED